MKKLLFLMFIVLIGGVFGIFPDKTLNADSFTFVQMCDTQLGFGEYHIDRLVERGRNLSVLL